MLQQGLKEIENVGTRSEKDGKMEHVGTRVREKEYFLRQITLEQELWKMEQVGTSTEGDGECWNKN